MTTLLCILSLAAIATTQTQELDTTESEIQYQIDAGIKFMCVNQFESNGQFLYEAELQDDTIAIDDRNNDLVRQGGGLYAIGMYYRLNYHRHNDNNEQDFSITDCIDNTMRYLTSESIPIIFTSDNELYLTSESKMKARGELIDGNTGSTALAIMGLIEICIINDNICNLHLHQFVLWINGLLTMRNHKLITIDKKALNKGAFTKKLSDSVKTSAYYDSESYLALSKLLKHKNNLLQYMNYDNKIWNNILNIINGLDEYYIEYTNEDDAHWLIQAWYNRWVLLNKNIDTIDNFMNYYMIQILMKNKLESKMNIEYNGGRCYLVETITDVIYAVNVMIKHSKYNNNKNNTLYIFNDLLWNVLKKRYEYMSQTQMFMKDVDFYFEPRFDGGFVADSSIDRMRIDDTQHCVCALMKINALLFMAKNVKNDIESYTYMDYNDPVVDDLEKNGFSNATNYDIMIGLICLIVVIVLTNIIFFYWCYCYPKQQKERNDLFWLGQTMESATSDAGDADSDVLIKSSKNKP